VNPRGVRNVSRYTPYNQPVTDAGQFRIGLWTPRDLLHATRVLLTVAASVLLFGAALWTLGRETSLVTLAPADAWRQAALGVVTHPAVVGFVAAFPVGVVLHESLHAAMLARFTDRRIHLQMGQFARSDVPAAVHHFRWMDEQIPWYGVVATSLAPLLLLGLASVAFHLGGHHLEPFGVVSGVLAALWLAGFPSGGDIGMVRHAVYLWHLGDAHEQARARHAAVHG
jgi:hypothetical protein